MGSAVLIALSAAGLALFGLIAYAILLTTYIVARDESSAIIMFWRLLRSGYGIISDRLGEFVSDAATADRMAAEHLSNVRNLGSMAAAHPGKVAVAIKPTALGLTVGKEAAIERARTIVSVAQTLGVFVWFDAENKETLPAYQDFVLTLSAEFMNVGAVVQAMHVPATSLIEQLSFSNLHVRIVKGAYGDGEIVERQDLRQRMIDLNQHALAQFGNEQLVAIGSCDEPVVERAGRSQELQLLWGVRGALAEGLRKQGRYVTIYCPFGSLKAGHGYFMRRLKEGIHPSMIITFIRNIFEARRFRKTLTRD